jgi:hypothetical protein
MPTVVSYGVSAPVIVFLIWYIREVGRDRSALADQLDKERAENRQLSERLLDQQKELLPLARDMTAVLTEVSERFEQERRRSR